MGPRPETGRPRAAKKQRPGDLEREVATSRIRLGEAELRSLHLGEDLLVARGDLEELLEAALPFAGVLKESVDAGAEDEALFTWRGRDEFRFEFTVGQARRFLSVIERLCEE